MTDWADSGKQAIRLMAELRPLIEKMAAETATPTMLYPVGNRPKLSKRDVARIHEMKRNGCTQADIAECMDVHPATISRTCRGIYHK